MVFRSEKSPGRKNTVRFLFCPDSNNFHCDAACKEVGRMISFRSTFFTVRGSERVSMAGKLDTQAVNGGHGRTWKAARTCCGCWPAMDTDVGVGGDCFTVEVVFKRSGHRTVGEAGFATGRWR